MKLTSCLGIEKREVNKEGYDWVMSNRANQGFNQCFSEVEKFELDVDELAKVLFYRMFDHDWENAGEPFKNTCRE